MPSSPAEPPSPRRRPAHPFHAASAGDLTLTAAALRDLRVELAQLAAMLRER